MQAFNESDLEFTFGTDWIVKKYDDHAYFKMLAGHGLKGVDFIGIYRNETLFLIEVKNFQKRSYSPVDSDWTDINGDAPLLGLKLYSKIEGSLRLIRIVNKYLSTRWWFCVVSYFRRIFGKKEIKKDWHFWTRVGELCDEPATVQPVLWLEVGQKKIELSGLPTITIYKALEKEYAKKEKLPTKSLYITSIKKESQLGKLKDLNVAKKEVKKERKT